MDEVALQALLWEVQAGDRRKDWRMVYGLFDVGGKEDRKSKSLEGEDKELRARLEALERKEGEGAQGGQGLPSRRESGMDE